MKKISLFATMAFLAATVFTSCDDCVTCEFADGTADTELCDGNDLANELFIAGQELAAGLAGTTVTCD